MNATHDRLGRLLAAFVGAVAKRPLVVLVVIGVFAFVGARYAAGHLGINTDTANMISPTLPWRQDFIAYRDAFPARDRNIVIAVDAADEAMAADAARALATALESREGEFERVFLAGHGEFFESNGLLYLSLDELEALSDRLVEAQPLIGRLQTDFSGAAVLDLAAQILDREDTATVDMAAAEPLLDEIAATLEAGARGRLRPLGWTTLVGGGAAIDGGRQLLLVRPVLEFERVQPAQQAIAAIRDEAARLRTEVDESVSVRLSGTVAMEHEELVSVTRGASTAGIAALVMVIAVLLWALRSVVLLLLSLVTLLTGLVFTAAFAGFAVGHLNLISVAFAVLYVGLGVDFILHFCLRLKELVASGHDRRTALAETAGGVGASLVICAVTTAAGFFAFIPTDFDGVSELGLISGAGMFVSLVVSLTLLPALLALFWRPRAHPPGIRSARLTVPVLQQVTNPAVARGVILVAAVAAAVALLAVPRLEFDSNPIHLRDPESESIRLLNELASASEAPLFSMAAIADDPAVAAAWAASLDGNPLVERVVTASALVPAEQEDKVFVLEDLRFVLGSGFAALRPAGFEAAKLTASLDRLQRAAASGGSSEAVQRLRQAATMWADTGTGSESRIGLDALDAGLRSDLPAQLERLDSLLSAMPFGIEDLPEPLRERWVDARGRELVEFVPAEDLNDNAAAERFVAAVRAVAPRATGLPVVYQEASRTIVSAFSQALLYAFVMVTVLLVLLLRHVRETLLVLLPILFAAAVSAGIAVLFGLPLNFANIIALPLLIGVGVDNGIHIVHRMRTEPPATGSPFATSTSRAVLASGLTTIASFGNLAFSEHLGMASMGQLLTVGMVVTLVATLVLLPALLSAGPRR